MIIGLPFDERVFMKLLHTSDWHLGASLCKTYDRTAEFQRVFDWMLTLVEDEKIDVFLIAGDVFDSCTPPNSARALFYDFISDLSRSCCRHLVIVGGNHDSSSLLDAPSRLLKRTHELGVHVIGGIDPENPEREVLLLTERDGRPGAVICAVPYIPEARLRLSEFGESVEDKDAKSLAGYREHYRHVGGLAQKERERIRTEFGKEVPIIVTGHLPVRGCETMCSGDDGMRKVMIGNLNGVGLDVFPESADYVALGHIHRPYAVDDIDHIRYSGSIVPIGFDETEYPKKVFLVDFEDKQHRIKDVEIPRFRRMKKVVGASADEIYRALDALKKEAGDETAYFKAVKTGEPESGLYRNVKQYAEEKSLVCCSVEQNSFSLAEGIISGGEDESVGDFNEHEAFDRLLKAKNISSDERAALLPLFNEAVNAVLERDVNAGAGPGKEGRGE